MKLNRFLLLVIGLVLLNIPKLFSQTTINPMEILVSTEWLEDNLSDSLLVILHYGKPEDFEKEHIPNSRLVSLKELIPDKENGLRHELPDDSKIEMILKTWGINNGSKILICYADENALPMAARLFFTLDYAGLGGQTAILNGGLPVWKSESRILTSRITDYNDGKLIININRNVLADKNWVNAILKNKKVSIIDARPEEQYSGSAEDHNSARKGHIEGAVNIPFYSLACEDTPYLFKSREDLTRLFEENNIPAGSTIVSYCGSGIWASPVYFIAKLLGYDARLYDGSFQEWGNDNSLPVSDPTTAKNK